MFGRRKFQIQTITDYLSQKNEEFAMVLRHMHNSIDLTDKSMVYHRVSLKVQNFLLTLNQRSNHNWIRSYQVTQPSRQIQPQQVCSELLSFIQSLPPQYDSTASQTLNAATITTTISNADSDPNEQMLLKMIPSSYSWILMMIQPESHRPESHY